MNSLKKLTCKLRDRENKELLKEYMNNLLKIYETLKKVATQKGDLQRLIKNDASVGNDIPYDELNVIMIKDISLK